MRWRTIRASATLCFAAVLTATSAPADDVDARFPRDRRYDDLALEIAKASIPIAARSFDVTLRSGATSLHSTHSGRDLGLERADLTTVGLRVRSVHPVGGGRWATIALVFRVSQTTSVRDPASVSLDGAGAWNATSFSTAQGGLHAGMLLPMGPFALSFDARLAFGLADVTLLRVADGTSPPSSAPQLALAAHRPPASILSSAPMPTFPRLNDGEGTAQAAFGIAAMRASAECNITWWLSPYVFAEIGAPGPMSFVGVGWAVRWPEGPRTPRPKSGARR